MHLGCDQVGGPHNLRGTLFSDGRLWYDVSVVVHNVTERSEIGPSTSVVESINNMDISITCFFEEQRNFGRLFSTFAICHCFEIKLN